MSSTVGNTILAMFGCKTTIQHFLWSRRTFLLLARFVRAFFSFFSQLSSSTIPERSAIAASLRRPPPTKDFFVEIIFLLRWLIDDARLQIWPNHLLELLFISGNCRCTIHTRKAEWIEINFHVGFLGRCASDFLPYSACRESAPSIDDFSEWKRHLTCKTLSSESGARSFVIFFFYFFRSMKMYCELPNAINGLSIKLIEGKESPKELGFGTTYISCANDINYKIIYRPQARPNV